MRILISSRNTLIPKGVQQLLAPLAHEVRSHYYQSADQLVAKAILERSDLVILDKCEESTFTLQEILQVRNKLPRLKIVVISTMEFPMLMQECYAIRIAGYLTYDCNSDELEEALKVIDGGDIFFCRNILAMLLPRVSDPETPSQQPALTPRELEIARLIAAGSTNKQMGAQLNISPHTVHTHRKSLMKKLGLSSAREVALFMINGRQIP